METKKKNKEVKGIQEVIRCDNCGYILGQFTTCENCGCICEDCTCSERPCEYCGCYYN